MNSCPSLKCYDFVVPSIKIFDVAYNDLEGDLPASIGSLGNRRNDCVPTVIRPCVGTSIKSNLEELYLNGNKLEGPLPEEFGNLQGLKRLELSNNKFDGDPEAIGYLFNLGKWPRYFALFSA